MSVTGLATIDGNSTVTVAHSLAVRHAATTGSTKGTTSSSSAGSAASQGITSNDFLTLLVTEMKNQDPTQPTDPNAYIQQLVSVNSLQQLISINQDLTTSTATAPATPTTPAGGVTSTDVIAR